LSREWEKVIADVKKGKVKPAYVLYGDDEFRLERALRELVEALVPETDRAMNLAETEGAETAWGEVIERLRTVGMFGGRKVVVVKDAPLGAGFKNAFNRARSSWKEGGEAGKRRAANIMMGILGELNWPPEALGVSVSGEFGVSAWKDKARVDISEDDSGWMNDLAEFARNEGMTPRKKEETAELEAFLKSSDPAGAVLVATTSAASPSGAFYKVMAGHGEAVGFGVSGKDSDRRATLKDEIGRMLAEAGKKMDPEAMLKLELKTGFNLRNAASEVAKLIIYAGDKRTITAADVEAVVPRTREESIFKLTDAMARRDTAAAIGLVQALVADGHHPLELLGILHSQVRNLFLATGYAETLARRNLWNPRMSYGEFRKRAWPQIQKTAPAPDKGGKGKKKSKANKMAELEAPPEPAFPRLHPYVAYNALRHQENFEVHEIEKAFHLLARVDDKVKSSSGEPVFLLEQAIMSLCGRGGVRGRRR